MIVLEALVTLCLLAGGDPFSGTWKLNLQKSKFTSPVPRSQTALIQADAAGLRIREEVVTDTGEKLTITVDARFDGKDYPITGAPFADAVAYERVDSRTIRGVGKKSGRVVMRETVVVSADGKTVTGTYTSPDGKPAGVAVFDKQ